MNEFRFLNFWTEYSCQGTIKKSMRDEACFSYVFHKVNDNSKVHYKIIIRKGTEFISRNHKSNACLLNRREVKNHINQLKTLYPLRSYVVDCKDRINVHLRLEKVPTLFHKYALTWVRYLYEYPYNVLIRDAYLLKEDPRFRFESIANLFNLAAGCFCDYIGGGHCCLYTPVKRLTTKELKGALVDSNNLNGIYSHRVHKISLPTKVLNYNTTDIEYWTDPKIFQNRKKLYLKAYDIINKK